MQVRTAETSPSKMAVSAPRVTPCAVRQKIVRLFNWRAARVLELFSGSGGLSLRFHAAGFEIAAAIESDLNAAAIPRPEFFTTVIRVIAMHTTSRISGPLRCGL
jgi:hypothetical protein